MKILLDTDIGSDIDDALALLLLLRLPKVEIVGVTTVYGNVDLRAKVARKILGAAGLSVPVFSGAGTPLGSPMPIWHARTEGRGVLDSKEYDAPLDAFDIQTGAGEFIAETIAANPGEITLVSLGALTNVAQAISARPEICKWIKTCYFMGGGITYREPVPAQLEDGRTYSARPSHNVRCDVKAAQIVFDSAIQMRILTNDVTTSLWWDGADAKRLRNCTRPALHAIVGKMLDVWLTYRSSKFFDTVTGTCPHDPLTVAEATGHSFVGYAAGMMSVNNDGSTHFSPTADGRHAAGIGVDDSRFLEWYSSQIFG